MVAVRTQKESVLALPQWLPVTLAHFCPHGSSLVLGLKMNLLVHSAI